MADIGYITATIVLFLTAISYTRGCDRLGTKETK